MPHLRSLLLSLTQTRQSPLDGQVREQRLPQPDEKPVQLSVPLRDLVNLEVVVLRTTERLRDVQLKRSVPELFGVLVVGELGDAVDAVKDAELTTDHTYHLPLSHFPPMRLLTIKRTRQPTQSGHSA